MHYQAKIVSVLKDKCLTLLKLEMNHTTTSQPHFTFTSSHNKLHQILLSSPVCVCVYVCVGNAHGKLPNELHVVQAFTSYLWQT